MTRPAQRFITVVAAALMLAACGGRDGESTTTTAQPAGTVVSTFTGSPPDTSAPLPSTIPEGADVEVPPQLAEHEIALITLNDESLLVAIADNSTSRSRGLMEVTDLLDLDGMLFVWPSDTSARFWMRDTVIPLDIAFFGADGTLVNSFSMEPCDLGSRCPRYASGGEYRYALETGQGRLGSLGEDTMLTLPSDLGGE